MRGTHAFVDALIDERQSLMRLFVALSQPKGGGRTKTLQVALEDIERDRAALLSKPYTTVASRRMEALDELADRIWALLEQEAKGAV